MAVRRADTTLLSKTDRALSSETQRQKEGRPGVSLSELGRPSQRPSKRKHTRKKKTMTT